MNNPVLLAWYEDKNLKLNFRPANAPFAMNSADLACILGMAIRTFAHSVQQAQGLPEGEKEQIEAQVLELVSKDLGKGGSQETYTRIL